MCQGCGWSRASWVGEQDHGRDRCLMSRPALKQERKLHKDSGGGTSSGFLPSGLHLEKRPEETFLIRHPEPSTSTLPAGDTPSAQLPLPLAFSPRGPHPLLRLLYEVPTQTNPTRPSCGGGGAPSTSLPLGLGEAAPQKRREKKRWGLGDSPRGIL